MDNKDLVNISDAARETALGHICDNWPAIIKKIAELAVEGGSVPHAKFLWEWSHLVSPLAEEPSAASKKTSMASEKKDDRKDEKSDSDFSLAQLIFETLAAYDRGEWSV